MRILSLFLFCCGVGLVAAENARTNLVAVSTTVISALVEEARTNNPALRAALSRVNAAQYNSEGVRTWEDPMLMLGGSVFGSRGFDPAEEGDIVYGIEQKLPLWQRPRLTRKVAETEVGMRREEAGLRLQQLRQEITKSLLMIALAERELEIGEQDLAWLEVTGKEVENKYRSGMGVVADTLQIQNDISQRRDQLRTAHNRLAHEHLALNRLLNRDVKSSWPVYEIPDSFPALPFSQKLLDAAVASEPRLKVMEQEIRMAAAQAELTKKTRLPDVSFGVEAKQYHGDPDIRMGMFKVTMSFPWGNAGKYRKDYSRDKEREKAAIEDRLDQILMVREQIHHLTVQIEAMGREANLYTQEISNRSLQILSNRLRDWETGKGMFRDVMDSRRSLLDSQLMAARAVVEQRQAVAELLLWTGLESTEALSEFVKEPSLLPEHSNR